MNIFSIWNRATLCDPKTFWLKKLLVMILLTVLGYRCSAVRVWLLAAMIGFKTSQSTQNISSVQSVNAIRKSKTKNFFIDKERLQMEIIKWKNNFKIMISNHISSSRHPFNSNHPNHHFIIQIIISSSEPSARLHARNFRELQLKSIEKWPI